MIDIGSTATQSMDNSIRTAGHLLHDLAQIATTNKAHGAPPGHQTKDLTAVTGAQTELLNACNRNASGPDEPKLSCRARRVVTGPAKVSTSSPCSVRRAASVPVHRQMLDGADLILDTDQDLMLVTRSRLRFLRSQHRQG
jgi:hypothetical protein